MIGIKIKITKFISDDQPGWIECTFKDAWGVEHVIEEKVPVITTINLNEKSEYPQDGYIACEILKEWKDNNGRGIVTVSTEKPWGISSINDLIEFDLQENQLAEFK